MARGWQKNLQIAFYILLKHIGEYIPWVLCSFALGNNNQHPPSPSHLLVFEFHHVSVVIRNLLMSWNLSYFFGHKLKILVSWNY
jgi:hypothetical protein